MLQHNLTLFRIDTTNDGMIYTASSDGTISCTDLDTGIGSPLLNLNPNGWNVSLLWSCSIDHFVQKEFMKMLFQSLSTFPHLVL
jgi:hypothetical protein